MKVYRYLANLFVLLALSSTALFGTAKAAEPTKIPLYSGWKMVAASSLIVCGTLEFASQGDEDDITIAIKEVYKGHSKGNTVHFRRRGHSPTLKGKAASLSSKPVIAFLTTASYGRDPKNATVVLASEPGAALKLFTPSLAKAIKAEISNQKAVAGLPDSRLIRPNPEETRVLSLLDKCTKSELDQEEAFAQLIKMGRAAVPGLVLHMNDRRRLPSPAITLENSDPSAFEAVRHYTPELVVDAIAAILNQLTGEYFGGIESGDAPTLRANCVQGWRVYLWYTSRPVSGTPPEHN